MHPMEGSPLVKRILLAAALALVVAHPAAAQVNGAFSEAHVVPVDGHLGGAYLQFDSHDATLQGQLRLSFYPNLDFGFNGGLSRINVDHVMRTSLRIGADFRGQVSTQERGAAVSTTLGAAIGVETADSFNLLSVGPQFSLSRTLGGSGRWIGYGSLALLYSRIDLGSTRRNDTSFPLRAGVEFRPNPDLRLLSEVQVGISDEIRDDVALTVGVLFPF